MWLLALSACTPNVTALYDRAREEALAVASDRPAAWSPDVTLGVAAPTLEAVVAQALDLSMGADSPALQVKLPMGLVGRIRPRLTARSVRLTPTDACAACFHFDAALDGTVPWTVGPVDGSVPVDVTASGVVGIDIRDGRRVELTPRKVESVRVVTPKGEKADFELDGPVQDWVRAAVTDRLPPIRVTELDTKGLPVRDLRLRTSTAGVLLEVLSDVPGGVPVPAQSPPARGVVLVMAETTLAALARRAAFEAGTLQMDVAVDPRGFHAEGGHFTMDLRVWRLTGRGWWRDYDVTGTVSVVGKKLRLVADHATETDQSRGAALVDPLAALFEGKILEAIVDNAQRSLPGGKTAKLDAFSLSARASAVEGVGTTLVVTGDLEVLPPGGP